MTLDPSTVVTIVGMAGAGAVAWGAAKAGASLLKDDVTELRADLNAHAKSDHEIQLDNVERLSSLETLVREIHRVVVHKK